MPDPAKTLDTIAAALEHFNMLGHSPETAALQAMNAPMPAQRTMGENLQIVGPAAAAAALVSPPGQKAATAAGGAVARLVPERIQNALAMVPQLAMNGADKLAEKLQDQLLKYMQKHERGYAPLLPEAEGAFDALASARMGIAGAQRSMGHVPRWETSFQARGGPPAGHFVVEMNPYTREWQIVELDDIGNPIGAENFGTDERLAQEWLQRFNRGEFQGMPPMNDQPVPFGHMPPRGQVEMMDVPASVQQQLIEYGTSRYAADQAARREALRRDFADQGFSLPRSEEIPPMVDSAAGATLRPSSGTPMSQIDEDVFDYDAVDNAITEAENFFEQLNQSRRRP